MHSLLIFVQPNTTFSELRQRPAWWAPLTILSLLAGTLPVVYFSRVDPAWWAMTYMDGGSGADELMFRIAGAATAVSAIAWTVFSCLCCATYLFAVSRWCRGGLQFCHAMALAVWSSIPVAVGLLASILNTSVADSTMRMEELSLTTLDPLLFRFEEGSAWHTFGRAFDLIQVWSWLLLAIGWRCWSRDSWTVSTIIAFFPFATQLLLSTAANFG